MGNPPGELTPEAKAEIAEAIRIVREDRFEKFLRERLGKPSGNDPPNPTPPPPKDPTNDPPTDPPKRGLWWPEHTE